MALTNSFTRIHKDFTQRRKDAELLKCFICSFFIFFLLFIFPLNAQGVSLSSEIERLETLAENQAQRHEALTQLARLYQLSGNREKALELWLAASAPQGSTRDNKALLEAVKLLISMGEFDRAGAELRTILMTNRDEDIQVSAWYLNAQLEIFKSGNHEPLNQLAGIPQFSAVHSKVFYTLWRVSNDASWRTSLINSYPRSVEAGILSQNSRINAAFTPQWLLLPPREELSIAAVVPAAPAPAPASSSSAPTPAASAPASATPAPAAAAPAGVMLQTGLLSREDNARALAQRLNSAGFNSVITRRSLSNGDFWAVNVPAGSDVNQTIARLKSAGFDAFPVN